MQNGSSNSGGGEQRQGAHDAARSAVLDALLMEAVFDGWTPASLARAARQRGQSDELSLLFPEAERDALAFWAAREDEATLAEFAAEAPEGGITAKITWLVRRRIERLGPHRQAARRGAATLALPPHAALGARLTWRTADRLWRAVGDRSTDFNHYSKRAILSGVYASTFARWLADEGEGAASPYQDSWEFLDARIGDVMRFEKTKAQVQKAMPDMSGLVGTLARLRYGTGR